MLRSGWRVVVFLLIWILFSGVFGAVGYSIAVSLDGELTRLSEFALGSAISLL